MGTAMNRIRRNWLAERRSTSARTLLAFLVALVGSCATGCKPPADGKVAYYDKNSTWFTFGVANDSLLGEMHTGEHKSDPEVEPIYVELRDGQRVFLPDLTLEIVKPLAQDTLDLNRDNNVVWCIDVNDQWSGFGSFEFQNGRLFDASMVTTPGAIVSKISLTEEGPYVPLKMSRKKMIEMFGKPDKWQEFRYQRGP
jgi:hypothetical protein